VLVDRVEPIWAGKIAVVCAPGPSLTPEVTDTVYDGLRRRPRSLVSVTVNNAFERVLVTDVLYACDAKWWNQHAAAVARFGGERWSSHSPNKELMDNKAECALRHNLLLVNGRVGEGWSTDPSYIHYGSYGWNSGFAAVNFTLHRGARRVLLVGFDMRKVNGQGHFFGQHPLPLRNTVNYGKYVREFELAAAKPYPGAEILNCTPGSALTCFPYVDLATALALP
jgi:hypothetical protein